MYLLSLPVALAFWLLSPVLSLSTRTPSSQFVTVSPMGLNFLFMESENFNFVGTNAYWLPYLNTEKDIRNTLANMSKSGISVVRTWAFNGANNCPVAPLRFLLFGQIDVTTIPKAGSWLQLIKDGNTTFNTGPNGIQRLDTVIKLAKEFNIYVYFSLTNNWYPIVNAPVDSCALPRNYLSNFYGGMDVYVQEFCVRKTHDEFYTNKKVRKAFYKYVRFIVSRYVNEPGVIAWELANDARCASTLPASDQCNTNTITRWHAETAKFIRSIDYCPKLFPPPPPPSPGSPHKRTVNGFTPPWEIVKRVKSRLSNPRDGVTIRGLWSAPKKTKRQGAGGDLSVFNGAFGVDSLDILNAPDIDFGTFQLFPDSVNYGVQGTATNVQAPSRQFNKTLNDTVNWISTQAFTGLTIGKPIVLSAFGIVTQDNLPFFVPANETCPVVKSPPKGRKRQSSATFGTGVNQDQIGVAYSTWLGGLTSGDGSPVPNPSPGGSPNIVPNDSPNDGLGIAGPQESAVPAILANATTTRARHGNEHLACERFPYEKGVMVFLGLFYELQF
ncbi:glycoside hydrolase superfamily [Russula aff. rugulosa BPL654]|nr:glycoside hydrolase superfamily [Russula aff. rugulosa BPL654]